MSLILTRTIKSSLKLGVPSRFCSMFHRPIFQQHFACWKWRRTEIRG